MDSQLPPSKKRTSKRSTVKTRKLMEQIKQDVSPLFRDIFDDPQIKTIKDINCISCKQDPSLSTIIYLSRHILSHVSINMLGIDLVIIPLFISLTPDSYIREGGNRVISPGRVAVYFLCDSDDGRVNCATCLIGAIKINKKQEEEVKPIFKSQRRHIEF